MATNEREHELEGLLIGRGLMRRRRMRRLLLAHLLRKRRSEGGEKGSATTARTMETRNTAP